MIDSQLGTAARLALQVQRAAFRANPNPSAESRRTDLKRFLSALLDSEEAMMAAIDADFSCRSRAETLFGELYTTASAIRHALSHLADWMKPRSRSVPVPLMPGEAWVQPQPIGVVGIISPWNFPVNLALIPLLGALAAGNRAMLKPSEITPATSDFLGQLLTHISHE